MTRLGLFVLAEAVMRAMYSGVPGFVLAIAAAATAVTASASDLIGELTFVEDSPIFDPRMPAERVPLYTAMSLLGYAGNGWVLDPYRPAVLLAPGTTSGTVTLRGGLGFNALSHFFTTTESRQGWIDVSINRIEPTYGGGTGDRIPASRIAWSDAARNADPARTVVDRIELSLSIEEQVDPFGTSPPYLWRVNAGLRAYGSIDTPRDPTLLRSFALRSCDCGGLAAEDATVAVEFANDRNESHKVVAVLPFGGGNVLKSFSEGPIFDALVDAINAREDRTWWTTYVRPGGELQPLASGWDNDLVGAADPYVDPSLISRIEIEFINGLGEDARNRYLTDNGTRLYDVGNYAAAFTTQIRIYGAAPVPEPATFLTLGIGLLVVGQVVQVSSRRRAVAG